MKVLTIKESELTCNRLDGGGVPIYYHNGSPFTGIVLRYYDTGELFCEEEYKDGYQEGWFRSYHKNGKKYTEYKAHNNVEYNGTYKNHFIMKEEKIDKIIISLTDVKKNGLYNPDGTYVGFDVRTEDYKENPEWNEFDFKKEVFEELLGDDFGKKDFYYEPNTWEFVVDALENKIRDVLKTMKKVPEEHTKNPMEYLKTYKNEHFDPITNRSIFYEDVKEFLGELYHYNIRENVRDKNLYYFQLFYNHLKSSFKEGFPLYITAATIEDQK